MKKRIPTLSAIRIGPKQRRLICLILATILIAYTVGPAALVAVKTGLLMSHILSRSKDSPLTWVTRAPYQERVQYEHNAAQRSAAIYRPRDGRKHSALILSLGATVGMGDLMLASLADGLARVGVVVIVPESDLLHQGFIVPDQVENLIGAFQYLKTRPFVNAERIGFAGFCIGSSLAVIAASDERINQEVTFLTLFSGYYNALELVRVLAMGRDSSDEDATWDPDPQTLFVFTKQLLNAVDDPRDFRTLINNPGSDTSPTFSKTGRIVHDLLVTKEPEEVDAILARLPPDKLDLINSLSPSEHLDGLQAKVYMMYDRDDPAIPPSQPRRLMKAIKPELRGYIAEFTLFHHVRPRQGVNWLALAPELIKLYRHLFTIMLQLEGWHHL